MTKVDDILTGLNTESKVDDIKIQDYDVEFGIKSKMKDNKTVCYLLKHKIKTR
jgi:hypothetical protein